MSGGDGDKAAAPHWLDEPGNVARLVLLQGVLFFGIGLAIWYASGRDPRAFVRLEGRDLLVGLATGGALIGAMQAIAWAVPGFIAWAAREQRLLFAHGRLYRTAHIWMLSAAAGVGEEALFRGGLQTIAADHMPGWAAILAASLLFTVIHLASAGIAAFIFALSLVFGLVYHFTGSLPGMMVAHMLFDVWALALIQAELVRQNVVRG